ncbi:MAG: flavodoxin domain-containing protein [Alphaproteobacteria bacterium]|nr:flavodoxin domain-containing protein [Alphaproteobacteria bacterium]
MQYISFSYWQIAGDILGGPVAKSVTILIGTITGTAELVAEDVGPVLEDAGYDVAALDMDGLTPDVLCDNDLVLICTSTYGQGDVPDNAMALYEALVEQRPDLSSLRYGIIGLGDSTYADTYNQGGARFDKLLQELGAKRVGEVMRHNASSDELPEEAGVAWARDWVDILAK